MDSLTNSSVPDNDTENTNKHEQQLPDQQRANNAVDDNDAGKVTGTHQNNGYGNTPDEDEQVDPDLTQSDTNQ